MWRQEEIFCRFLVLSAGGGKDFSMEKNSTFMKTRPVFSLLVSMAVPMMLSMLIQSLYNIVDSIYVARLGTKALTAVSFRMRFFL